MFTVNANMTKFFFDRARVANRITEGRRRGLSRAGAYLQRTASKTVLRRRSRTSMAGEAPSVHAPTGAFASLKTIWFIYDERIDGVRVGPIKVNGRSGMLAQSIAVPGLHEHGGSALVMEEQFRTTKNPGRWFRADQRKKSKDKRYRTRLVRYAPRPFMKKALDMEVAKGSIVAAFKDTITGP